MLAPEGDTHSTITDQSRLQILSVLLVGTGLALDDTLESYMDAVLPTDFDLTSNLRSVFGRLIIGLAAGSLVAVGLTTAT